MRSELHEFIREALAKGLDRKDISAALEKAGWKREEIAAALDAYADVDFPVPVPRPRPYLSAREAFMYLVLFVCLYISAFSFGSLLFDFINRWVPDPLRAAGNITNVRRAVASLIVAFPIYLWLSTMFARSFTKDPEKRGSRIRKWLSYVTLFIAAVVIIGDLITLLYNLLNGELTVRFVLKVLTVLLIAGMIFGYYLWDLRRDEAEA